MFKIKNFKVEFKHLLTVVSAFGMVAGFIVALCSKKKATACAAFFASFAGLVAGLGMESGLVPEPAVCSKLEIELDDGEEETAQDEDAEGVECTEDEEKAEDGEA